MPNPSDLRYTQEHEWVRVEDGEGTIGVTDYAQDELGDIVYVDLPAIGTQIVATQKFGEIESVKAISDLYSPISGEVVAVNTALADKPEMVNQSPLGDGWLIRARLSDPGEVDKLLTAERYDEYLVQTKE